MSDDDLIGCGSCKYFEELKSGSMGKCRRNPPQVIPGARGKNVCLFPLVNPTIDWCGEYEDRDGE